MNGTRPQKVVDGADWSDRVPEWYRARPIVGWSLLSRPVSFYRLPFLPLSSFFSPHSFLSRYRTSSSSSLSSFCSFFSFFLFSRSLVLVAEDALTLDRCSCPTRNLPLVNYASAIVLGLLRANWASVVVVVISSSRLGTLNLDKVMIRF